MGRYRSILSLLGEGVLVGMAIKTQLDFTKSNSQYQNALIIYRNASDNLDGYYQDVQEKLIHRNDLEETRNTYIIGFLGLNAFELIDNLLFTKSPVKELIL
jgi:hypothetical protein